MLKTSLSQLYKITPLLNLFTDLLQVLYERKKTNLQQAVRLSCTKISCHFTCKEQTELEHFHVQNFHSAYEMETISYHEIPNSRVKRTGTKFHMWNVDVRNMDFAYEIETIHIWNIIFICEIACETFVTIYPCTSLHIVWKLKLPDVLTQLRIVELTIFSFP